MDGAKPRMTEAVRNQKRFFLAAHDKLSLLFLIHDLTRRIALIVSGKKLVQYFLLIATIALIY